MKTLKKSIIALLIFAFIVSSALLFHWAGQGYFVYGPQLQGCLLAGLAVGAFLSIMYLEINK